MTAAAFFSYEWGGKTLSVGENAPLGTSRETRGRLNASAGWLWSVFPKRAFLSGGQGIAPISSPPASSIPGVVVAPFDAKEEGASRRITELFSEPVGVEPQDDRSGLVRSRLAPEEPFLYVMVPVRKEPQTGVPKENSP
ncbi:MAG: hypothetical protein KatS3mg099_325 [Candidatus Parcubacteria bacterium]|nr:MAG: hypothetical protein KatS3mg099_325 [Candidatus Parcubacteria bacterium]